MNIREFKSADTDQVIALWKECDLTRPWNDPAKDIQRRMELPSSLFIVGEQDGKIIAVVMGGYDGHRGWMNYLAVSVDHQRRGLATQIINNLEARLQEMGCAKLNLQIRTSNVAVQNFYSKLGFSVDDVVSMGKRLIPDN